MANDNLLPTVVFVVFCVAIPFVSWLLGDVFRPFNPWRAVGRATGWVAVRVSGEASTEPLAYPTGLGRWPAAIGILGFAWVELAFADRDDPRLAVRSQYWMLAIMVGFTTLALFLLSSE